MSDLVLSLFPGIGILDKAFEDEGFCVVRGPDLLWGGNVKLFHPPAGHFTGMIGGPPCQKWTALAPLILKVHGKLSEDLIPEFERVVREGQPDWFLMENVRRAPAAAVPGYQVHAPLFDNRWIGGLQSRMHRFSFGSRDGLRLQTGSLETIFENIDWHPRVLARGAWVPKLDRRHRPHKRTFLPRNIKSNLAFREACKLQGLPDDFDLPGFTVEGKLRAIGNAVPYPMARALATAVKMALIRRAA